MGASPLPVIRGSYAALYPFTQTFIALTGKSDGQNATATRWVKGYPLVKFVFPFDPLVWADKTTLKSFFASSKGQFSTNLTAATDQTYNSLSLDIDQFEAAERNNTVYGVRWGLTQTVPQNLSPGAPGGQFPLLANNAMCQLPYVQRMRFQTNVAKVESGPKYTYAEFGGGLSNFPSGGLMGWQFTESVLTDAEVNTKVAHFLANWGDCYPFNFTDENATTLAGSISSGATGCSVGATTEFPATPFFLTLGLAPGAEQVKVTNVSATSLTIVRAQNGTTASAWGAGTNVAVTYQNVYYASNEFTVNRVDFNRSSITTSLVQMF